MEVLEGFLCWMILAGVVLLIVAIWWAVTVSRLRALRYQVDEARGVIATQARGRHESLPNLKRVAEDAARIQAENSDKILGARKDLHTQSAAPVSSDLPAELIPVTQAAMTSAGNRPVHEDNQKIDPTIHGKVSDGIMSTQHNMDAARRFEQAAIAQYNAAISSFPSSIVAAVHGFTPVSFAPMGVEDPPMMF
jgi:LemA protein